MKRVKEELTTHQKKFIDMVSDKVSNLNIYQFKYFNQKLENQLKETRNITPIRLNMDFPSVAELENPDVTPKFFKQQELMAQLTKWLGNQTGPNAGAVAGGAGQKPAKVEKVVEKIVEKKEAAVILILILYNLFNI
jgi:hypothetical protein